ncbi:MAG: FHA domain-containing protein, partial [Halobacteriales archaeon]|nr:FHA domain-containing protein [Halobacteriales archaeon]
PKMILVRGGLEGAVYPLGGESRHSWLLGRGPDADVLLADPYVSRRAAGISREGDAYFIEDLAPGSNGTRLNGRLMDRHEMAPLADGDIVTVGTSLLVFRSN